MNLRLIFTIAAGKLLIKACRIFSMGGTTLPGKVAMRLYPAAIRIISSQYRIIMVTGTNGKTTTTRIIGKMLEESGISYITNKSGANLVSGVATAFIEASRLSGKAIASTALIEMDEAAFNVMMDYIEPDILVVTNFFRDQLDRYGELYSTLKSVVSGISKTKKTRLVLNADDSLCASIGRIRNENTSYFGFSPEASPDSGKNANSDAVFCIYCKERYEYTFRVYGHLGGFRCPACGYERPSASVLCTGINELTASHSVISFELPGGDGTPLKYDARINLPGLYNIYNALAAVACGRMLGLSAENAVRALDSFECGFGRMETIKAGEKYIKVILVKNPTGFNQVLSFLLSEDKSMLLAFAINDKLADGTDISWLWDVEFEKLQEAAHLTKAVYASGTRAEDMAVRLKYAGTGTDKIKLEKDYLRLIDTALEETAAGSSLYILPTYTAMLDIRNVLKKKFGLKEIWK